MKFIIVTTMMTLLILFYSLAHHIQPLFPFPWLLTLFLFIASFSMNYWLIPGGYAWRNYQNPPSSNHLKGPFGWPVLGSIPLMGPLAHRHLASAAASLGAKRLMALSFGPNPVVISSHPETARQILCGSAFSDRPVHDWARILMFDRAIGFAPSGGDHWRRLRRIAVHNMFSPRRISTMEGIRSQIASEMVTRVSDDVASQGFVEIRRIFHQSSLRSMVESMFGRTSEGTVEAIGELVREGYEVIGTFNWEIYFPMMRFLDFHGLRRRCQKLADRVKSVVGLIVEERRRERSLKEEEDDDNTDFLGALLSLPEKDRLNDSDIVAVLWEMIFRGTDTVTILLEWIMARMVLHPNIQTKAQLELDAVVGFNRQLVRDSDIPNLPYLQSIVKEVLRLHPPGPLLSWARLATRDVHIDKVLIPAGSTAMVNMWAIAHDGSIWRDPWVFEPERFLEEDVSVMGNDLRLAPFGSGRRVCPGRALGLSTVHLWIARLLHEYEWRLATRSVKLSECLKLSLEMEKPLVCRAVPRHRNNDIAA